MASGLKTGAELAPSASPLKSSGKAEPKYKGSGKTGEGVRRERGAGCQET